LKKTITIATILTLYSISFLVYGSSTTTTTTTSLAVYARSDLPTIKSRDLVIDLDNGLKTNAQLTYPAVDSGNGKYPGVLLITGSGAEDMNETGGYIRIDNKTGEKIYPSTPSFQIAQYLSERGFAVLRYDKRGVGTNHTILDSNVWGNLTANNLVEDANKALGVLMNQPEVDGNKITVLGHSEGTVISPRLAIDNPNKVKNIVLMGTPAQNMSDILYFQTVTLPISYAQKVLDKNHNGLLSLQEASKDVTFQRVIGGNISLILTQNLSNGTKVLNAKDNPNNDTYIEINSELKPALIEQAKSFFAPSKKVSTTTTPSAAASGKCMNLEGCPMYSDSFLALESNLNTITNVPSNTSILIMNGENDTQTPVLGALLLQQKLTEINHTDHVLITYPNLGHEFYPSSQWQTEHGPIPPYVLADLYSWLESHSGFTHTLSVMPSSYSSSRSSSSSANSTTAK
jgi:alpha-beta hydrolase superfamily lysophospholipase